MLNILVPQPMIVDDGGYVPDGGSVLLEVKDANSVPHQIWLRQHSYLPETQNKEELAGRLYIDDKLVDIRSELEKEIIEALKSVRFEAQEAEGGPTPSDAPRLIIGDDLREYYGKIHEGPLEVCKWLVDQIIGYVESEEYVEFGMKSK